MHLLVIGPLGLIITGLLKVIYEKCIKILETYFGVEDEEEMPQLAPQMVEGGDQFAFGAGGAMEGETPTFDFSGGAVQP